MAERYYFGQGRVYSRVKGADSPAWRWWGDVSALTLAATENVLRHQEHYSGNMQTVRSIRISGETTLTATLFQIDNENLAQIVRGTITDIAAGTVASENLGTVKAGDILLLENGFNVSTLEITDSAGTPVTIDPAHYDLDARTGRIEILSLPTTAPTMPLKASYQYAGASGVVLFNSTVQDIEVRYEGINLAEGGAPVIVELYRVSPGALQSLSLIASDTSALASMPWTADVLADTSKPSTGELGQVGRFLQINEA